MKIKKQIEKIKKFMPIERKPAKIPNQQFLNALLHMIENGCKWRALPKKYGNWHTIYVKFNRWSKNGTVQQIFDELQTQNVIDIQGDILCLDTTSVKVHPNASDVRKSSGEQILVDKKGANDKNTYGLCFRKVCLEISSFCRKSSRRTGR